MKTTNTQLVVVGAGPGGYAAAFYAADRGMQVTLVEQERRLGGVCLNYGCIPSKALLHAAKVVSDARQSEHMGIRFEKPTIDLNVLRTWKNSILDRLTGGISSLAKRRNVDVIQG